MHRTYSQILQDVVHRHIADHKETIFDGAADILVDSLKCTSVRVGQELKESVEYLSEKVRGSQL